MKLLLTLIPVLSFSCKVTQRQEIDGEVIAKVVVEFPQAQECFDDPRIETFEQLQVCLDLVTNNRWTVTVNGEIVPVLEDMVPEADAPEGE